MSSLSLAICLSSFLLSRSLVSVLLSSLLSKRFCLSTVFRLFLPVGRVNIRFSLQAIVSLCVFCVFFNLLNIRSAVELEPFPNVATKPEFDWATSCHSSTRRRAHDGSTIHAPLTQGSTEPTKQKDATTNHISTMRQR
ncbi:unnamed protein product [Chondrus crispus]|uniref:Uncharacterized protein n=1 Tax=Chondrus crispus TaxID=2769 RepID=R7QER5_CHOCR|nr:unnamed protein product [Chondrus crispus]CDF36977.1 unnamed protein product [Chondrus crispus]|eukprot:XP_005716796.1 unnamed protein product [Chondrus crispus]